MVLLPWAERLTTLDKTGFKTADRLSAEMRGTGNVMKERERERERLLSTIPEPMEIKSASDTSIDQFHLDMLTVDMTNIH